jgi:hypothetical protein
MRMAQFGGKPYTSVVFHTGGAPATGRGWAGAAQTGSNNGRLVRE